MSDSTKVCVCVVGDVFVDVQANQVDRLPTWNSDTGASSIEVLPGTENFYLSTLFCKNTYMSVSRLRFGRKTIYHEEFEI